MTLWKKLKDNPPKDRPFLAKTEYGVEMMEWKDSLIGDENMGWFGFKSGCSCCSGYCSSDFDLWMEVPE